MIEILKEASFLHAGIEVGMLRLDKIHPIVSGNKIFKLKYYLEFALTKGLKKIVTVGGPYSNHLHATAFAARQNGLLAAGILKGTKPAFLSDTLKDCLEMGMELHWQTDLPGNEAQQASWAAQLFPGALFIPQGGKGKCGVKGAAEIMAIQGVDKFDTILAACGTGTMGAGLIMGRKTHQRILLVSVLKNNFSISSEICALLDIDDLTGKNTSIDFSHHHGGYARKSADLLNRMNHFYKKHAIPTDFVYTGKLIHALYELLKINALNQGEKILLIHSGGLQGNRSLTKGELIF